VREPGEEIEMLVKAVAWKRKAASLHENASRYSRVAALQNFPGLYCASEAQTHGV
jgi:PPE-repeat protein